MKQPLDARDLDRQADLDDDEDDDHDPRSSWRTALDATQPALQRVAAEDDLVGDQGPWTKYGELSDQQASGTTLGASSGSGGPAIGAGSSPQGPSPESIMAYINGMLDQQQQTPPATSRAGGGGGGGRARQAPFVSRPRPGGAMAIPPIRPPLQQAQAQQAQQSRTQQLAKSLRIFENLLGDWSAERKAAAIKQQYGLVVDPRALRWGDVWWRRRFG